MKQLTMDKLKLQGILTWYSTGKLNDDEAIDLICDLGSNNINISINDILNESKKYQQSTVNKMGIEREAFGKGAMWVLSYYYPHLKNKLI